MIVAIRVLFVLIFIAFSALILSEFPIGSLAAPHPYLLIGGIVITLVWYRTEKLLKRGEKLLEKLKQDSQNKSPDQ